jgi:hypothetical protein
LSRWSKVVSIASILARQPPISMALIRFLPVLAALCG